MADTWKTNRSTLRGQNITAKESAELDKEGLALVENILKNAFKKDAPVSEDFGEQIAGFISKAASVKLKGVNAKQDPTPAISGASAGNGNTETPTNKSDLDTLIGSTSQSNTVVKKIVASGSLEGVRQASKDGLNLSEGDITNVINQAVAAAEVSANDPATQEKFKKIGIEPSTLTSLVSTLTTNVSKITSENHVSASANNLKKAAAKQMKTLDNPFGSFQSKVNVPDLGVSVGDPIAPKSDLIKKMQEKTGISQKDLAIENPFGSMGIDFGNIQGALTSLANGLSVQKDLGVDIPIVQGANNVKSAGFASAVDVPNIVDAEGFTNIAGTVTPAETIPDTIKSTTPVEELGVPLDRPLVTLLYTTVHSAEEVQLEISSVRRDITRIIVGWTQSTSDKRYESAKQLNERFINKRRSDYGDSLDERQASFPFHYVILKDGTIQRILNTEVPAVWWTSNTDGAYTSLVNSLNSDFAKSINIAFDAGYTCTEAEKNIKFLSKRSITPEQWESYDLFVKSAFKANNGLFFSAMSDVFVQAAGGNTTALQDVETLGPGFNVFLSAILQNAGIGQE